MEIGARLLLRHPVETDRAAFIALRQASRSHLEPWEPLRRAGFDAWGDDGFDLEIANARTRTQERLLICEREGGAVVGRLSIGGIERGPLRSARFGYWIGAGFTRRGYMTEALGLGLRYCFETLGLHRVEANIIPDNEPSRRAARSAGLRLEGYSPRYLQIAGVWRDHERYAVTVEDWRAAGGGDGTLPGA